MEPVIKTLTVRAGLDEAFRLFTAEIARWWPLGTHHLGRLPPVACAIEPAVGGRIYETGADGRECDWGRVLAWEPPHRFAMSWTVNAAPGEATEVTVTFAPVPDGTEVRLDHAGWQRSGPERGAARRAAYDAGWERVFIENYGRLAGRVGISTLDQTESEDADL